MAKSIVFFPKLEIFNKVQQEKFETLLSLKNNRHSEEHKTAIFKFLKSLLTQEELLNSGLEESEENEHYDYNLDILDSIYWKWNISSEIVDKLLSIGYEIDFSQSRFVKLAYKDGVAIDSKPSEKISYRYDINWYKDCHSWL